MASIKHRYESIDQTADISMKQSSEGNTLLEYSSGSSKNLPIESAKRKSSSCCNPTNAFLIISYVVLVVALIVGFLVLKQDIDTLQNALRASEQATQSKYEMLLLQFADLHSRDTQFQNTTRLELGTHQAMLIRLSNGTSNADVLDRLRESNQAVSAHLQASSEQMAQAQADMGRKMNATLAKMEDAVVKATSSIHSVTANVSAQLTAMRANVGTAVVELNAQVQSAQAVINEEVEVVKSSIERYVIATNEKFAAENDFVKYQLAGTFTLLSCLISLWHLTSHLRHYHKPDVQRRVMAVLWMVPIYSITSWLSLVLPNLEHSFGAVRDCYEAYVIYTFIALLIAILEDGRGLQGLLRQLTEHIVEERAAATEAVAANPRGSRPKEHIKPPFACCYQYHRPSSVASAWLFQCRLMALQFVLLKPLLTLVPLVYSLAGCDLDKIPLIVGHAPNWHSPMLYILFLQNLSVAVAFWGLLSFYHGAEKDLEWCDPWPKFLCIKGVVFATFWQSLTIQCMSSMGFVDERSGSQIANLLICIEMLIASLLHFYIFPHQEWAADYKREREKGIMLRDTLALRDFVKDMRMMITTWDPPAHGTGGSATGGSMVDTSPYPSSSAGGDGCNHRCIPPRRSVEGGGSAEGRRLIWCEADLEGGGGGGDRLLQDRDTEAYFQRGSTLTSGIALHNPMHLRPNPLSDQAAGAMADGSFYLDLFPATPGASPHRQQRSSLESAERAILNRLQLLSPTEREVTDTMEGDAVHRQLMTPTTKQCETTSIVDPMLLAHNAPRCGNAGDMSISGVLDAQRSHLELMHAERQQRDTGSTEERLNADACDCESGLEGAEGKESRSYDTIDYDKLSSASV